MAVRFEWSALVQLVSGESPAARTKLGSQVFDDARGQVDASSAAGVVGEPAAELLVQRGVLGARPLAGSLDELCVGAQGDGLQLGN
jgi:hypothetical protein